MKKISIIVPTLSNGGAERVASNLTFDFENVFETKLILFDNKISYPYIGDCICINIPKSNNFVKKIVNIFRRKIKIKRIKSKEKFDCSISLLNGPNYINVKSKIKNEKTIVSVRNIMSQSGLSGFETFMLKQTLKKADYIVSLSEVVKYDLIKNYGALENKIITIYNSCDGERLKQMADSSSTNPFSNFDYIVTMGRLFRQKGHWHLIRAMVDVVKTYPDLKLVILGQGEECFKNRLINLTEALGLTNNIIFAGFVDNPHKIISKSKMFVFPSLYEGLGNVVLEALACGKAVISTDCIAGPREILAPNSDFYNTLDKKLESVEYAEYGVLVPPFENVDDIETTILSEKEHLLSSAITSLLSNKEMLHEYERKALIRINDFDKAIISKKWTDLINKIVDKDY